VLIALREVRQDGPPMSQAAAEIQHALGKTLSANDM
jgi:hypothetical protein